MSSRTVNPHHSRELAWAKISTQSTSNHWTSHSCSEIEAPGVNIRDLICLDCGRAFCSINHTVTWGRPFCQTIYVCLIPLGLVQSDQLGPVQTVGHGSPTLSQLCSSISVREPNCLFSLRLCVSLANPLPAVTHAGLMREADCMQ